jgi:hypothetical protein
MIAGIQKLYAGNDEVVKVYAGSDIVYTKGGTIELIEQVIMANPTIQTYIQMYPYLYNRIYEWSNLLFSLATTKGYTPTMYNSGLSYVALPTYAGFPTIDCTCVIKNIQGTNNIFGSRTDSTRVDDTWVFFNGSRQFFNRPYNNGPTLALGADATLRFRKYISDEKYYGQQIINGSTTYGSGSYTFSGLDNWSLFGFINENGTTAVSGRSLYIGKTLFLNQYELVPFKTGYLDIRTNIFYPSSNGNLTFHLFQGTTEISNPDISMLL